jgi:transposase-like protein
VSGQQRDRATGMPRCPFCESEDTELMSLFGSSPLTSQYYCRGCRSAFEQVKWGTLPADRPPTRGGPS